MSDNTSDPARIERDLDQTRSRLGDHLSELQDRLSPGQVLDDLMGYFRGSEGAEFGRSLLANVRDNPMPTALTGIGLAWLMASNPRAGTSSASATELERLGRSGSHLYGREDYGAAMVRVRDAEQGVSRLPDEAEHDYSVRLDDARGQALGLARHGQESAESFGARVRDALSSAQDSVANAASSARDQVGSAVNAAGDAVGSLTASAQGTAQGALRSATGALAQGGQAAGQASSNLVAALTESPVLLGARLAWRPARCLGHCCRSPIRRRQRSAASPDRRATPPPILPRRVWSAASASRKQSPTKLARAREITA